jgi:hypothetical protein
MSSLQGCHPVRPCFPSPWGCITCRLSLLTLALKFFQALNYPFLLSQHPVFILLDPWPLTFCHVHAQFISQDVTHWMLPLQLLGSKRKKNPTYPLPYLAPGNMAPNHLRHGIRICISQMRKSWPARLNELTNHAARKKFKPPNAPWKSHWPNLNRLWAQLEFGPCWGSTVLVQLWSTSYHTICLPDLPSFLIPLDAISPTIELGGDCLQIDLSSSNLSNIFT